MEYVSRLDSVRAVQTSMVMEDTCELIEFATTSVRGPDLSRTTPGPNGNLIQLVYIESISDLK